MQNRLDKPRHELAGEYGEKYRTHAALMLASSLAQAAFYRLRSTVGALQPAPEAYRRKSSNRASLNAYIMREG